MLARPTGGLAASSYRGWTKTQRHFASRQGDRGGQRRKQAVAQARPAGARPAARWSLLRKLRAFRKT